MRYPQFTYEETESQSGQVTCPLDFALRYPSSGICADHCIGMLGASLSTKFKQHEGSAGLKSQKMDGEMGELEGKLSLKDHVQNKVPL